MTKVEEYKEKPPAQRLNDRRTYFVWRVFDGKHLLPWEEYKPKKKFRWNSGEYKENMTPLSEKNNCSMEAVLLEDSPSKSLGSKIRMKITVKESSRKKSASQSITHDTLLSVKPRAKKHLGMCRLYIILAFVVTIMTGEYRYLFINCGIFYVKYKTSA